jgi:serine/threonine protein phosphatase PrpC
VLLLCTDGLWSGLKDAELAAELSQPGAGGTPGAPLREKLLELGQRAVTRNGASSDNTSAAALRWLS